MPALVQSIKQTTLNPALCRQKNMKDSSRKPAFDPGNGIVRIRSSGMKWALPNERCLTGKVTMD